MNAKPLFIMALVILILAMGGCFGSGAGHEQPGQPAHTGACYEDARAQLSPQWASASALDRAVAAFSVISICEGNQP
jgi:hypothetical protein